MDVKDNSMEDVLKKNRKKIKELAIEELRIMTYYRPNEEMDPKRIKLLTDIISKDEYVPEKYKEREFYNRFKELNSDIFIKNESENVTFTNPESELKTKHINQELESEIKVTHNMNPEPELKKPKLMNKYIIRFVMFSFVFLAIFGVGNIVTYVSARQSVFEVVEQAVGSILIKFSGDKYYIDEEYQVELSRKAKDIIDYSGIENYFHRKIYLPSLLPEIMEESTTSYTYVNGYSKLYVNLFSKDQEYYLLMELNEAYGNGDSNVYIMEYENLSEYNVNIENVNIKTYVYESDDFNASCFVLNDIFYFFRYNISVEQFLNVIQTMEVCE